MSISFYYHIYFIIMGLLLGIKNEMAALTIACLYIMFCWFHVTILMATNPMDFSNGSYCPICQKVTGMNLKHCNKCKKCVNDQWFHNPLLNRCGNIFFLKRWLYLFKLVILLFIVLSMICSMVDIIYLLLVPLHLYVLKSTYMKQESSINNKFHGLK